MKRRNINDNPVIVGINYLANIILINLLFIVFSLPIFTIGAAYSSMLAMAKEIADGNTSVISRFFLYFKDHFKQSSKCWLCMLPVLLFLLLELYLLLSVKIEVPTILFVGLLIVFIFILGYIPWVFIQTLYFECNVAQQLKNGFLLMLGYAPQTALMILLGAFPIALFIYRIDVFAYAWPLWLFLYFGLQGCLIVISTNIPMSNIVKGLNDKKDN